MSETSSASPSQPLKAALLRHREMTGHALDLGIVDAIGRSLSFGLTHLNTVERRKIRSGSSRRAAGDPGHSIDSKRQQHQESPPRVTSA
jgi:hypothetical protein